MRDIVEAPLLLSVKDAARLLGITPWICWQLCELRELDSGYHGRQRLISHESMRRYADLILRNSGAS